MLIPTTDVDCQSSGQNGCGECKAMSGGTIVAICQYGGEFITNSDGTLSYSGGDAHAIDVSHDMTLDDFKAEIVTMCNIDINGMSVKYFLPSNRRVLISISNDKDLQRMVHFNINAISAEVFILNKADNRATRSTVADSGTSIVATAAAEQNAKRKRLTTGGRTRVRVVGTNAPTDGDNFRQRRPTTAENVDNRITATNWGMPVVTTAAIADDIRHQELIDFVDDRATRSILPDPDAYVTSLATQEGIRPLNISTLWDDAITGVGQEFDNVKEFRGELCKYAICKGFAYKFVKNETARVTVKCTGENCPWRIHASESSRKQKFVIKKMNNEHTCGGGNGREGQRRATRQWLTSIIKEKLQVAPHCKPKEIVREIYEHYGVSLTYSQVWRGKEDAQKELYSALTEIFRQLPWLCERILATNPGSMALLSPTPESNFRRLFVSFHASLQGFENGCRPLIFLDKIPLKANTQCKLLAAAAVDGDDAIFPVAFAAVEDETFDSWAWFLAQLKFGVGVSRVITFVSNRQKGLDEAVPRVFEDSHHSFCLHQLIDDFKFELKKGPWSQHVKDTMVDDFVRAAQACTVEEFNASLESIRNVSVDIAGWVMASKPENWSDAIFRGSRYDHFSSNIMDSFNNWIPVKSEATTVLIIDAIMNKLIEMMDARREAAVAWESILTPSMEQKLQKEISKSRKLNVLCSSDTVFEVRGNTIYVVNIGTCECTCRRWQISGLPCHHAIAVFNRINRSVYDYCSGYFKTERYHLAYSEQVNLIPDIQNIDYICGNLCPPVRRPSGRPRRKRFNPNRTVTVVRLCSRCKEAGHNKATCEAGFL